MGGYGLTEQQLDWAVGMACFKNGGAEARWKARRVKGLTDAEMLAALKEEFTPNGAIALDGCPEVTYWVKTAPRVGVRAQWNTPMRIIDGEELMARARREMSCPEPVKPGAQLAMDLG